MDRDPFDLVGDVLDGQFRVVAFAGEGDLSVVYKGHHIGVDAPVAIKCLDLPATLDGALVRPLVESFREASRLHYKLASGNLNIAQAIASGSTLAPATGMIVPYLVREWFEGESLREELARRRKEGKKGRSIDEALAVLEPAVDAVSYAHKEGALHLSLNPNNLFLADKEGKRSLKVLDFGVSRAMNDLEQEIPPASRPAAGLRVLFPSYAAPEQLDATVGKLGAWTDVYALALLFMELLSDRPVVSGQETGALVERVLDEHRRPTPQTHGLELPRNLDLVLTRAVARVPSRRQKTATDLWNDVKTSLRGATSRGFVAPKVPVRPAPPHTEPESPAGPPSVAGAVPARRVLVPETSNETIPMGFPIPGAGPTYVPKPVPVPVSPSAPISAAIPLQSPLPQPAIELEIDLPPVHVLTTPLPPHADTPALPPVMVTMDTPPQMPALPPPGPRFEPPPVRMPAAPTFVILDAAPPRRKGSAVVWITVAAALVGGSLGVALVVALKRHPAALAPAPPAASSAPGEAPGQVVPPPSPSGAAPPPSAAPSSTAPGPPSNVEPTAHFPALAARAALEAASHEIAHCRRGKVWGTASANVTFGNDGTISHVTVGVPFTGTPTGACVSEALSAAHVPPFAGRPVILSYKFFVPIK